MVFFITMIPISARAVVAYLFVDPCGHDPIIAVIDHRQTSEGF